LASAVVSAVAVGVNVVNEYVYLATRRNPSLMNARQRRVQRGSWLD
jgi:hypothetical protein